MGRDLRHAETTESCGPRKWPLHQETCRTVAGAACGRPQSLWAAWVASSVKRPTLELSQVTTSLFTGLSPA